MSAGRLTTHVLDTANGHPARGMTIELVSGSGDAIKTLVTNADGRCDGPLLEGAALEAGAYELRFHVGDYFAGLDGTPVAFLDVVPVRFVVADPEAHYHVPLLVSPFGYSTYRGS